MRFNTWICSISIWATNRASRSKIPRTGDVFRPGLFPRNIWGGPGSTKTLRHEFMYDLWCRSTVMSRSSCYSRFAGGAGCLAPCGEWSRLDSDSPGCKIFSGYRVNDIGGCHRAWRKTTSELKLQVAMKVHKFPVNHPTFLLWSNSSQSLIYSQNEHDCWHFE